MEKSHKDAAARHSVRQVHQESKTSTPQNAEEAKSGRRPCSQLRMEDDEPSEASATAAMGLAGNDEEKGIERRGHE